MTTIFITLIFIFTLILYFWKLGFYPPTLDSSCTSWRIISAACGSFTALVLYFLNNLIFKKQKISLLISFVYSILPWVIEQSRIVSQVNITVLVLMLGILFYKIINNRLFKIVLLLISPIVLYFSYPSFWLIHKGIGNINTGEILDNLLKIYSFNYLFFFNDSFWWGGVRDSGLLLLSFLPFLAVGIYQLLCEKKYIFFILILTGGLLYSLNPSFPEGREFYLTMPVFSIIIGYGIYKAWECLGTNSRLFVFGIALLFVIIDMSLFFHTYYIHYQYRIEKNIQDIHEIF